MPYARCISCGVHFPRDDDEHWKVRCLRCFIASKKGSAGPRSSAPPPPPARDPIRDEIADHMRALLMLCHPDRHANSPTSTKVTQWLLNVRERISTTKARA